MWWKSRRADQLISLAISPQCMIPRNTAREAGIMEDIGAIESGGRTLEEQRPNLADALSSVRPCDGRTRRRRVQGAVLVLEDLRRRHLELGIKEGGVR